MLFGLREPQDNITLTHGLLASEMKGNGMPIGLRAMVLVPPLHGELGTLLDGLLARGTDLVAGDERLRVVVVEDAHCCGCLS